MLLGQQTILKFILLFLLILALSSCSPRQPAEVVASPEDLPVVEAQPPSIEARPREPLYTYEKDPGPANPDSFCLSLNDEPLLLPDGYVRLVGVVSGGKPIALIEVGGRGRCARMGDRIGDHVVVGIGPGSARLRKRKEQEP